MSCRQFRTLTQQADQGDAAQDIPFWFDAIQKKMSGRPVDLKDFMTTHPYKAIIDVPYSIFPEEIMKAFPKTKFLLTVRDPEKW